jgi:hypothetical protein
MRFKTPLIDNRRDDARLLRPYAKTQSETIWRFVTKAAMPPSDNRYPAPFQSAYGETLIRRAQLACAV